MLRRGKDSPAEGTRTWEQGEAFCDSLGSKLPAAAPNECISLFNSEEPPGDGIKQLSGAAVQC